MRGNQDVPALDVLHQGGLRTGQKMTLRMKEMQTFLKVRLHGVMIGM